MQPVWRRSGTAEMMIMIHTHTDTDDSANHDVHDFKKIIANTKTKSEIA